MARRVEDVEAVQVPDWKAPPGLLERIEADEAAFARGEQQGMDWEDFEPILDGWIAECGPLDEADDEGP